MSLSFGILRLLMIRICQPLRFENPMTVAKFGNMSMLLPSSTCCQTSFYKNLAQKWEMYQQVRVWVSKGTYNCRPFSFWPSFWFANLSDNLEITPSQRLSHIVYPIYILKGVEYFYTMNQATHNNDIRMGSRDHLLINKVRVRSSSFVTRRQLYVISQ